MEIPSGDMPTQINSTIELTLSVTSIFSMSNVGVGGDDDASSDGPQRLSHSDRLMDRMVTGNSDVNIWIWIVEYLAKFETDIWVLHDVFEMAPQVPDYLGEYTNEMVAFRCLVYLFDPTPGQYNNVASGESNIEFGLSESCEYVLQCILDEIPLSDLKPGAPGLSKWNLLPFIENKRLCLPKCALELLKEASYEKRTRVFPSDGQQTMRFNGNNSAQATIDPPGHQYITENMEVGIESIDNVLRRGDGAPGEENDTSRCKENRNDAATIPDGLEENNEVSQAHLVVDVPASHDVPANHLTKIGIPSGNKSAHHNCTIELLVGDTSFSPSTVKVSKINDTSSNDFQRLSRSDRFRDRVVTGVLDIDIWIWVIEYLAKFEKELWTLNDVFETAPILPNDMGDYTNEMVAFRCLAYLFDGSPGQDNYVASGAGLKVEFDLSESCLHVLQCILNEMPLSILKPGAPELLKWNLLPFIENKRLCLRKCTFEMLREASREKNAGVFPSHGEETMGTDSIKNNQAAHTGENIDERMDEEGNSLGQGPRNGDGELGVGDETLFGMRDLCNVVIPDTFEENEDGNQDATKFDGIFHSKAKVSKRDPADATVDNADECTAEAKECFDHSDNREGRMQVRDLCNVVIPDTFEENEDGTQDTSIYNCMFRAKAKGSKRDPVDATVDECTAEAKECFDHSNNREGRMEERDLCNVVIPDTFEENDDGNQDASVFDGIFRAKAKVSKRDPTDAIVNNSDECSAEAEECFDHSNQREGRTALDHIKFVAPGEREGTSGADSRNGQTEAYHDVNVFPLVMANRITFSTDVGTVSGEHPSNEAEDSEDQEKNENIDGPSPDRYTCEQCKEGGKLLFCSNEGCPAMIHEKCLDSPPAYDADGNFYCPLCAYTLDSSEYLKSKAQIAEAKKRLVRFLHLLNSRHKEKGRSGNKVPSSQL